MSDANMVSINSSLYRRAPLGVLVRLRSGESISGNFVSKDDSLPVPVYGANGRIGSTSVNPNIHKESILVGRVGACGEINVAPAGSFASDNVLVVAIDNKTSKRWMYYVLLSSKLGELNTSTAQPLITASKIRQVRIPLPPLKTQRRIADYLDRETAEIDAAVADLDKYVELLETRRKLQIDGAFAPIIENREVAPLGIAYSIFNGDRGEGYPKADEITDQGVPFINAGDIRSGYVSLNSAKFVTKEKYDKMGGAKLRKGDIVFCLRGSLGKHGVVEFGEGSVASSLCVIRSIDQTANNSKFLNYFIDTAFFAEQILFAENGSAQPNLSGESLARFRIPSIPLIRQNFILRELDREVAEVNSLLAESVKLRELLLKRRSVLISDVVTGRKQV